MQSSVDTLYLLTVTGYVSVFLCYPLYFPTQPPAKNESSNSLLEVGVEKYRMYENISYIVACCKSDKVSTLYRTKNHKALKKQ